MTTLESVIQNENLKVEDLTRTWVIYTSSEDEISRLQREIDKVFSLYSFYPEIDWSKHGYRPPENYQVLGAWRNPNPSRKAFAFLLDNPNMLSMKPNSQLLVNMVGTLEEIKSIEPKVELIKAKFELRTKKEIDSSTIQTKLEHLGDSKSLTVLSTVLTIFTAIVNGFSLYLRQLPPPEFPSQVMLLVYKTFLAVVHFLALGLLTLVIIFSMVFVIKYGMLLIRKL